MPSALRRARRGPCRTPRPARHPAPPRRRRREAPAPPLEVPPTAAEGRGLGHRFLRHIERNSCLLFLIPADSKDHCKEFEILLNELREYNPEMLEKDMLIAVSKSDMLDDELKVIANIGGTPPVYDDAGVLQPMRHQEEFFTHPHDVVVDALDDSLYVAQAGVSGLYPIKLERV